MGLKNKKARITLIECVKCTGKFKSIALIGEAPAPVCFRGLVELRVKFNSQNKAWMEARTSAKWLADLRAKWAAFSAQ